MSGPDLNLPLKPPPEPKAPPTPAPAWVSLVSAWVGLLSLLISLAIPFVPGSRDPVRELTHQRPYSPADRMILVLYGHTMALALGILVLWQMRKEPRPLPDGMVLQRFQAWVGIVLALAGATFIYVYVWLKGPGAG